MDLSKELSTAKHAALKAGTRIMEIYEKYISDEKCIDIANKSDNSPLTEADRESNDIIISILNKNHPKYSILSEESKDDLSRLLNKYCWIIDPLDGTKEFIKKNGEFTVNIALSYKGDAVLGVIYVPVTGELYYASNNKGAYYEKDGKTSKIITSDKTEKLRMVTSRSHISKELECTINEHKIAEVKNIGSSLKGCLVAKGDAEVYYRFGRTMEWDTAAMQCIAEEAGAIFKQMDDTKMCYNREDSLNAKGFYIINRIENKMMF